jgi:hypothetical protein
MMYIARDGKNRDQYYDYTKEYKPGFYESIDGFHLTELDLNLRYILSKMNN